MVVLGTGWRTAKIGTSITDLSLPRDDYDSVFRVVEVLTRTVCSIVFVPNESVLTKCDRLRFI